MAESFPLLSEPDIRARFDPQSWQRGRQYVNQGAVIHRRRRGTTLLAGCQGSRPQPYRVEIMLNAGRIADAECSCPVGEGGYCKHTAAVLLTWLREPESFAAQEDLDAALARRSKEELIALI